VNTARREHKQRQEATPCWTCHAATAKLLVEASAAAQRPAAPPGRTQLSHCRAEHTTACAAPPLSRRATTHAAHTPARHAAACAAHTPHHTHRLDELAVVHERLLVLDVVALQPRLDLVAQALQLLDLRLELRLHLLLLRLVRRRLHLVVQLLEAGDALGDLLERALDLGCGRGEWVARAA
jgi:hypothetical protein